MESKQKRRYSCQSWHVAAKVVIKPEIDEDDVTETNNDDFVTALEDCRDESDDENLETCYEDLSETTTETLHCESDQHSRVLPKTGEEIINMCDLVQERLRKSLLLDDLPHDISCQQDIEAVNEMIHQSEDKSSDESKMFMLHKHPNHAFREAKSQTVKIPNWDIKLLPHADNSEYSRTILNSDDQSTKTFQKTDISSSETLCIDETLSETVQIPDDSTFIGDNPSAKTIIAEDDSNSMTLQHQNSLSINDLSLTEPIDTSITEKYDPSSMTFAVENGNSDADHHKSTSDKSAKFIIDKYDDISVTQIIQDSQDDSWRETSVTSKTSSITECVSQGRRGNSHLFFKIKQRYERSTCDSVTQNHSPYQDRPRKVLKEPNFASTQSVPRYQNIPIGNGKLDESNGLQKSKIKDKLSSLYEKDSNNAKEAVKGPENMKTFENTKTIQTQKGYTTVNITKGNKSPQNRAATVTDKTENVLNNIQAQSTEKTKLSAQILNGIESDMSDNHAKYEHPDPIKESHTKKTFDPHIYEEVSPPCSSFENEGRTKQAVEENIYAEVKADTTKGMRELILLLDNLLISQDLLCE